MNKALIIAKKEIKEIVRSKYILTSLLMPIILFGILMPIIFYQLPQLPIQGKIKIPEFITKNIPNYQNMTDNQRILYFITYYIWGPLLPIVPLMIPVFIAADSFAGEKERKTIEPILATPTTDAEIFLGKTLTAFITSMAISAITFTISTAIIDNAALKVFSHPIFPSPTYMLIMLGTSPLATLLSITIIVLISAQIANVRDTSQIGGVIILPVILIIIAQIFELIIINFTSVTITTIILTIIDTILLKLSIKNFEREKILIQT